MSAFGGKADIAQTLRNVRFWPKADIPISQLTTSRQPVYRGLRQCFRVSAAAHRGKMAASALLTSYLAADGVFLLIERLLLGARDVSVVEFGHRALLLADRPIFPMKLIGLLLVDLAFFQFFVYSAILIRQTVVDLVTTRMIALPLRLGKGRGDQATDHCERNGENNGFEFHDTLISVFPCHPNRNLT